MNKTTLGEAIVIMGPKLGLMDTVRNRDEIVKNVNRYRNNLYNLFQRLRLFSDYTVCLKLRQYILPCNQGNCETYYGVTLPIDMDGVMAVWEGTNPLDLRSEWFEDREGRKSQNRGDTEVVPIPGTSPIENDMCQVSRLRMYAHRSEDVGKKVNVTVIDTSGQTQILEFSLLSDTHAVVDVEVCQIKSVTLPRDLCGKVDLFQDNGNKLLSTYIPGITVPCFRRYKVITECPSGCVYVKGTQKYVPICDDIDVVEVGDVLVLEAAARYLRYYESQESKEQRRSAIDKQLMEDNIRGILSRRRGKSQQDGPAITSLGRKRRRRNKLPGYRRA
jgi:hypothetical protein|tara:strand:- start:2269 stop:3261 length:993 start_codon:yes stop_codon:yes gene_type:complete